jgi:kynureninase
MPVSVEALGADFLTGGVLKWLCGGPGGCFLYVAPGVRDTIAPALTGWQAHARPFGFEGSMEYASGPFRWLNGTPVIPALYAATEGPKLVRKAGIDSIRAKSIRQTGRLIALADARGFKVNAPRESARRGGTVAIDGPHAWELSQHLLSRDILVDYREGAGIRIAPHFYSSDEELEKVFAVIDEAVEKESWKEFEGRRGVVT